MHLNNQTLLSTLNREKWLAAGVEPVNYDRFTLIEATKTAPTWIHFGAGNIFRAYLARACQELVSGGYDKGVIAAEGYDYEIIDMAFTPYDNLFILVTLKSDGTVEKRAVASITEALKAGTKYEDFTRLKEIFRAPSLQMASFTITEKGYSLQSPARETPPDILHDFENGVSTPRSYMGRITALLHERYANGCKPIALVSMDNCSHNGDKLKSAILTFAETWEAAGLVKKGFVKYIQSEKVSFPWSMIDKITPAPHKEIRRMLESGGILGMAPIVTSKNSCAAAFVNAEQAEYLIIENNFPNGRPPLDTLKNANIIFTDRETVEKAERMKVCTCLNPLHTALAVFGCLLGYNKISEEMNDPDLRRLVEKLGYEEGLPAVTDPGIISPRDFLDEVINVRLPNPFLPDSPQRIATDTSQKLAIRFGETLKTYIARPDLDPEKLVAIPLVLSGWLRYLLGLDDNGGFMELSPDPLYLHLNSFLKHVKFHPAPPPEEIGEDGVSQDGGAGDNADISATSAGVNTPETRDDSIDLDDLDTSEDCENETTAEAIILPEPPNNPHWRERIRPLLEDEKIFGVNLYEAGLAEKVVDVFEEMTLEPGAVRSVLRQLIMDN
ncbi:MAG: mannitol dehydrogenase family protein [Oscillospiraceae bacterium]|nr:mannitol dehydrogenase family protein [Oscillospiraceae bacterium]